MPSTCLSLSLKLICISATIFAGVSNAAVERIEIRERVPFAESKPFGDAGAYEKIRGIAHFALDPMLPANARIVDLKYAPRDNRGMVTFSSEFVMLRPAVINSIATSVATAVATTPNKPSTLLYDVNNRGGIAILGQANGKSPTNNDPTTIADAGDGFLMRHGFTLLFSAWTWDVAPQAPANRPLVFNAPIAKGANGRPGKPGKLITGHVYNEVIVDAATEIATYAGVRGLTYEPTTPNDPKAVMTTRDRPDGKRTVVSRSKWQFVATEREGGPGRVKLEGSFQPGTIYELTYVSQDPRVTAAGLAGIRDLLAYFRDNPFEGAAKPKQVLIFGISQSGRLIGRMMHDGLNVDETGKLAFDGAYMQVPGAGGSAGFNSRFVQPTRHPSMLQEHDYPADSFPFTSTPTRDPVTGKVASTMDRAKDAKGRLPKLIVANTSAEFWNRGASLIATTPDGAKDVAPADNVRIYGFMGAQHYVGRSKTRAPNVNCVSTTDHYLPMRALILALDTWVGGGTPPPSAHPQIADGTLITVEKYRATFPAGFSIAPPLQNLREPRLNFGKRFATEGIADLVAPVKGKAYETRVPAPDADGNDRGGVRMVELRVPLGTHTGWNQRAPETGFGWATARFDGSFVPFARTSAERLAAGDSRLSLAERYATREDFVAKVKTAAAAQVATGLLLAEDVERNVNKQLGLYDRIMARSVGDQSCNYLFAE